MGLQKHFTQQMNLKMFSTFVQTVSKITEILLPKEPNKCKKCKNTNISVLEASYNNI